MSCTAQLQKAPEQKQGTWTQIFPSETVTETHSTLFVKKLVAVAVSNVTYLRAIFPENAFGDRCLDDLSLKILRDDTSCPGACQVIKWVKGCFDAIDRKYLKILMIGIYTDPENPDTVIESYTFKFSYNRDEGVDIYRNDKKLTSAKAGDDTKKATIRLLRTIVVLTQTLRSLPDNVMMTMKLLYHDNVTPADYEPPGFHSADKSRFDFETEPMNIKVGDIETPFHSMKLRVKTDAKQFQMEQDTIEEEDELSSQLITTDNLDTEDKMEVDEAELKRRKHEEDDKFLDKLSQHLSQKKQQNRGYQSVSEPSVADSAPADTPRKPGAGDEAELLESQPTSQLGAQDLGVRCACGCNEDDGLMILCAICNYWQHAFCFKVTLEEEAPERHICNYCGDLSRADLAPTDIELQGMTEVSLQATCLWRRALMACQEMSRVLAPVMSKRLGIEMTVAQGLINRLEKEGVIKSSSKSKRLGKQVNKSSLSKCLQKYMKKSHAIQDPEFPLKQTSQGKGKLQIVDREVDKLISQTKVLDVSGKRMNPKQLSQTGRNEPKPATSQRRGKKRAKPMSSDETDFEISNSQEDFDMRSGHKKLKASESKCPIQL